LALVSTVSVDSAIPPPAPGEDADDAAARYRALLRKAVRSTVKRFNRLASAHGGSGSVALANMGCHGVRLVFITADGTFGDAVVPSVAAANDVCTRGGWEITGWDTATVKRISPSTADRRRMAGTGR
jgi:hypothetical protein